jgi:hypothetical protein
MAKHLSATDLSTLLAHAFTKAAGKNITGCAASNNVVTVTATAHGYATGDWIEHTAIGGAAEANGLVKITRVDANSYTIDGLTAVTSYTSGGVAKKVSLTGLVSQLKKRDITALLNVFNRIPHVEEQDSGDGSRETAIGTLFAGLTP